MRLRYVKEDGGEQETKEKLNIFTLLMCCVGLLQFSNIQILVLDYLSNKNLEEV